MIRPLTVLVVLVCILSGSSFAQAGDLAPASRITFVSHRSGENLLYVMNPDGTGLRPIFGGPLADVPTVVEGTASVARRIGLARVPTADILPAGPTIAGLLLIAIKGACGSCFIQVALMQPGAEL